MDLERKIQRAIDDYELRNGAHPKAVYLHPEDRRAMIEALHRDQRFRLPEPTETERRLEEYLGRPLAKVVFYCDVELLVDDGLEPGVVMVGTNLPSWP